MNKTFTKVTYHSNFIKQFKKLPLSVQKLSVKKEQLFKVDKFHPILKTHVLKGEMIGMYSFSINHYYRIVFYTSTQEENTVVFFKIGTHSIYK